MPLCGKAKFLAVVLLSAVVLNLLFYHLLGLTSTSQVQLIRNSTLALATLWKGPPLQRLSISESAVTGNVTTTLAAQKLNLDNVAKVPATITRLLDPSAKSDTQPVSGSHSGLPERDAKDTLEQFKGESLVDSLKAECSTPNWQRVHGSQTVLEGSGLPKDLTYMVHKTCKNEQPPQPKRKLILNLNRQEWWFAQDKYYKNVFKGCMYDACDFTDDKSLLSVADAVFVTVCRLNARVPPPRSSSKQIWIAFAMESPVYYSGFHDSPHWKGVFNWTMTYRTDSDVFAPYGSLAVRSVLSMKNYTGITLKKTRAIAWFVSNCNTQSKRHVYVEQLQHHIDVDIYGTCSDKKCGNECLQLLNTTYYFYLSFENSICQDYVTEKLFKIYDNVDVVPIVRGGANYSRYFPPHSYLDTADYPSPRQLAAHLKALMADPQAYARLLEAKDQIIRNPNILKSNVCELCKHVHTSGSESKVYPDFMRWTRENICWGPSDV